MKKCTYCKDDVEDPCQSLDEAISGGCLPVPCTNKRLSYEVLERAKESIVEHSRVKSDE